MGPIGVAEHLAPFLPSNPIISTATILLVPLCPVFITLEKLCGGYQVLRAPDSGPGLILLSASPILICWYRVDTTPFEGARSDRESMQNSRG